MQHKAWNWKVQINRYLPVPCDAVLSSGDVVILADLQTVRCFPALVEYDCKHVTRGLELENTENLACQFSVILCDTASRSHVVIFAVFVMFSVLWTALTASL